MFQEAFSIWSTKNSPIIIDWEFLFRANAENLLKQMSVNIGTFNHDKFVQLSMDGPNINWEVLIAFSIQSKKVMIEPNLLILEVV